MKKIESGHSVLACGTDMKGVFTIARGRDFFTSRDFGDLSDYKNFIRFSGAVKKAMDGFGIKTPDIIACDMHPGYNSALLAEELKNGGAGLKKVQHHHAHIAACMRDNLLDKKVIGVAFDGTGYGVDGNIWGGEFMAASFKSFKRIAHLKYVPMPSSDMAVKEPWRMAASYLYDAFGRKWQGLSIPFTKKVGRYRGRIINNIIDKKINSPLTCSMGRLFDAAAAIIIPVFKSGYQAEAPIRLEALAKIAGAERGKYRYGFLRKNGCFVIETKSIIKGIVKDMSLGAPHAVLARRFHNTAALMISDMCRIIRKEMGMTDVALSGGVFSNKILTETVAGRLSKLNFNVYTHRNYSMTDAGVSIGQAMIALANS